MNMKRWVVRLSALTLNVGVIAPTTMTVTASEIEESKPNQENNRSASQEENVFKLEIDGLNISIIDNDTGEVATIAPDDESYSSGELINSDGSTSNFYTDKVGNTYINDEIVATVGEQPSNENNSNNITNPAIGTW